MALPSPETLEDENLTICGAPGALPIRKHRVPFVPSRETSVEVMASAISLGRAGSSLQW